MRHPDDDVLLDLALEADLPSPPTRRDATVDDDVREHVGGCATCSDAVQGYRRVADLMRAEPGLLFLDPPEGTWDAIAGQIGGSGTTAPRVGAARDGIRRRPESRPADVGGRDRDPSPVVDRDTSRTARGNGRWWWLGGGVAAGLATGLLVGSLLQGPGESSPASSPPTPSPTARTIASASLAPLRGGSGSDGRADLVRQGNRERLELNLSAMAARAPGEVYEVWLINQDGTRMVSIGVMPDAANAGFPVPAELVAQGYDIVDISREPLDRDPAHSGDSLLRGRLGA